MAETLRESFETTSQANPEQLAGDAVSALEASDLGYQHWIAGTSWDTSKTIEDELGISLSGAARIALKLIETEKKET